MTIDEIIKHIVYEECEYCAGLFCKQNKGCIYWNILEMLRELQWYRKKDLIRREDVAIAIWEALPSSYQINSEEWLLFNNAEHKIKQIPKAEPLKEV